MIASVYHVEICSPDYTDSEVETSDSAPKELRHTVSVCTGKHHARFQLRVSTFAGTTVNSRYDGIAGEPTACDGSCIRTHDIRKTLDDEKSWSEPLDAGWQTFAAEVRKLGIEPQPDFRVYRHRWHEDGDGGDYEMCFGAFHVTDSIDEMGMPGTLRAHRRCDGSCKPLKIVLPHKVASAIKRVGAITVRG